MDSVKKILITGASGLIGQRLTELLGLYGYEVTHLSRTKKAHGVSSFTWNIDQWKIDLEAFHNVDAIIHLAGAGINDKRWSAKRKKEILESRTESTRLLKETLQSVDHQVKTFISASGVGYYGFNDDGKECIESDPPGSDFLAKVTSAWEMETDKLEETGLRIVKIRIGVVLGSRGGALKELARPIRLMAGAPLGTGRQYLSWIHIDDLCRIFIRAIEDNSLKGVYNGVGPHAVTNRAMTEAIAKVLKKPLWLPNIPAVLVQIAIGGVAEIVLNGTLASSRKIQDTGFEFQFKTLEAALKSLLT